MMSNFLALVVVLLFTVQCIQGTSDCLADYRRILEQRSPSLYEQYCCTTANNGKTFTIPVNEEYTRYIPCTSEPPSSCPSKNNRHCTVYNLVCNLVLADCKSWFSAGSNTSGIYTINPDGGTPFEVCYLTII